MGLALVIAALTFSSGDYGSQGLDVLPGIAPYNVGDCGPVHVEQDGEVALAAPPLSARPNLVHVRFGKARAGVTFPLLAFTTMRSLGLPAQVDRAVVERVFIDVVGVVLWGAGSNEGFEHKEMHVTIALLSVQAQDDVQAPVARIEHRAENLPDVRPHSPLRPLHPPSVGDLVIAFAPNYRLPPFNHGPTIESARSGVKKRS